MYLHKIIFLAILVTTRACDDPSDSRGSIDSDEFGEPMELMGPKINIGNDAQSIEDAIIEPSLPDMNKSSRTIEVTNHCSFDIDLGFTGGFAGLAVDDECKKHQENDGTNRCFWNMNLQDFLESGQSTSVELGGQEDSEVVWSGTMFALKSPFMDDACPGGKCMPYQGPTGTVTLAEFTMLKEGVTYYDVSNIHGISVPTSIGPKDAPPNSESGPYREGTAGECLWEFEPPSKFRSYLLEVKHSHGKCSDDDDCDQHEVCGASFGHGPPVYGTCGDFFGYLNAHSNCIAGSTGYPFFCETYHDMYACAGVYTQSGYSNIEGGPGVCGCRDYEDLGIVSAYPCQNTNSLWEENAYKWIHYIKKGCPTGYAFQYDDATSTFTSETDTFQVTFCPGDSEEKFFI